MKDPKNDSTPVLERFGRDKRKRTVVATAERVERRPRLQRDAADSEQPSSEGPRGRASYNPHFTADNRPAFDKPRRQFGDKPAYGERKSGDKPRYEHRDGDKPRRQYGDKPAYGERKFGDKKYGDRKFGDKPYKPGPRKHDDKPASYPKFTPEKQVGEMRLNRFLAQSGLCSRREADDFITAGLVTVNGQIVTQLGTKVLPTDEVKFNDSRVEGEKKVYLVLNKPKGYVTSLDDPHADKTVMELVKDACTERIYPVGRLDKNSVGLLLFTNDGDLTRQLTHPSFQKKKIYQVSLDKPLTKADMEQIAQGITLEDGEIYALSLIHISEPTRPY